MQGSGKDRARIRVKAGKGRSRKWCDDEVLLPRVRMNTKCALSAFAFVTCELEDATARVATAEHFVTFLDKSQSSAQLLVK